MQERPAVFFVPLCMRACFLGQNICVLGNGIAVLQSPPLVLDMPERPKDSEPPDDTARTEPKSPGLAQDKPH